MTPVLLVAYWRLSTKACSTALTLGGPGVLPLEAIPTSAALGMLVGVPTNFSLATAVGSPDRNAGSPLENAAEIAGGGTGVKSAIKNLPWELLQLNLVQFAFGSGPT